MSTAEDAQSEKNRRFAAGLSNLRQGTCISIDWAAGTALVNVGGSTAPIPMVAAPIVNARCWVGFLANQPIVLGPVTRPPLGTATAAPSAGIVPVTGDDGQKYTVASDGFTITSGTRVLLAWGDRGGYVIGLPTADPTTGLPIQTGGNAAGGGSVTKTFNSVWSGTQNSGYGGGSGTSSFWTSDVWCGDTTLGAWGFGSQIADTIPDTAVIDGIGIYVTQTGGGGGSSPTFALHNLLNRGGTLTPTSPVTVSGGSGGVGLPPSFGDALKTGAAYGIATRHGGYWVYSGAATLSITYH